MGFEFRFLSYGGYKYKNGKGIRDSLTISKPFKSSYD